ncbi:MAG: hypothetical protein KDC98_05680, partial [Planctomycetes bacterium]|nr:hypothetical protein [Planctomycetota bacterium]
MPHLVPLSCCVALPLIAAVIATSIPAQCPTQWSAQPNDPPAVRVAIPWDPDGPGPEPERIAIGGDWLYLLGQNSIHAGSYDPDHNSYGRLYGLSWGANTAVTTLCAMPNGELIAGGYFAVATTFPDDHIARWDGTQWNEIGAGLPSPPNALAVLPSGNIVAAESAGLLKQWDGTSWQLLGGGTNLSVQSLRVLPNGDLIAGGAFTLAGNVAAFHIARWDGTAWHPIAAGLPGTVVHLATFANGDIAACHRTTSADEIAIWNGSTWTTLPGPQPRLSLQGLVVTPNDELYAWGNGNVRRWNGVAWETLPAPSHPFMLTATSDGRLVAFETTVSTGSTVAIWDGAKWQQYRNGLIGSVRALLAQDDGIVYAGGAISLNFAVNTAGLWRTMPYASPYPNLPVSAFTRRPNGDVIVGGQFTAVGAIASPGLAQFVGGQFTGMAGGTNGPVEALCTLPGGDVIAGGTFSLAGGAPCYRIARWDGNAFHPLASGMNGPVYALAVAGNGDLLAGGAFTAAGGVPASRVARWDGSAW